jgi:recombination protein RecA
LPTERLALLLRRGCFALGSSLFFLRIGEKMRRIKKNITQEIFSTPPDVEDFWEEQPSVTADLVGDSISSEEPVVEESVVNKKGVANIILSELRKTNEAVCYTTEDETGEVILRPRFLSTQHVGLDHILGGGIPSGRITELYSRNEGEGKSSVSAHLMAEMTRTGGLVVLFDAERGFTEERLKTFGVNPENLIYIEPDNVESVFKSVEKVLAVVDTEKCTNKTLIVLDSVAAIPSKTQFEADFGEGALGSHARALSAGFSKITSILGRRDCYFLAINQTRHKINSLWGDSLETSGGKALKFYASTRIELSKAQGSMIKKGDEIIGLQLTAKVVKNKIVKPFQTTTLHLMFNTGIDLYKGLFDLLEKLKMIDRNGAWYSLQGHKFQQKDFDKMLTTLTFTEVDAVAKLLREKRVTVTAINRIFPLWKP